MSGLQEFLLFFVVGYVLADICWKIGLGRAFERWLDRDHKR